MGATVLGSVTKNSLGHCNSQAHGEPLLILSSCPCVCWVIIRFFIVAVSRPPRSHSLWGAAGVGFLRPVIDSLIQNFWGQDRCLLTISSVTMMQAKVCRLGLQRALSELIKACCPSSDAPRMWATELQNIVTNCILLWWVCLLPPGPLEIRVICWALLTPLQIAFHVLS